MATLLGIKPKYHELSSVLKEQIQRGGFGSDGRIPTEQELAEEYKVSRNTVRQAVSLLQSEGYLTRRQGAGTFVAKLAEDGLPHRTLSSLVMLAVDIVLRENTYDFAEMAAAERWLSDRDIAITSANLVTSELIKGRRPAVLNQSHCQGLLFDGWVTDIHCAIAEELGLPYVVVGNHPVSPQIPQVRLDVEKIMGRMIDHLISMHSNQPIALLIRPPKLHIAHELLAAYLSKAQKLPQQESRLQLAAENSVTPAVQRLVASHKGPFSLITTEQETGAVVDAYHQLGLDPSQYPIVTIAAPSGLRASDRARVHLMPHPGGVLIIEALSRFLEAFQAGKNSVQASIDLGPILPPTQGGN